MSGWRSSRSSGSNATRWASRWKPTLESSIECLSIRDGELCIEGCSAESLAERFGTPLYVVSEDQLRRNTGRFRAAFGERWPGDLLVLPSIKANSCLALRHILSDEGTGCDVFGVSELEAALRTGTDPHTISLNGPMKDDALLERAIGLGVRITLDSRAELERTAAAAARLARRAHVRFRFRPDLVGLDQPSEMSPDGLSIRDAVQRYKAGIPTEDLLAIDAAEVADPNLDVAGIMFHLGRHSADPALWGHAVDALSGMLERLRDLWAGWIPRELDIGGGFPAPRDPFGRRLALRADAPPRSPGIDEYAEAVCPRLAVALSRIGIAPEEIQLQVEPGRALYADAGIHLATVGNVKRQTEPVPLAWVETDSSDAYLADVNLEYNRWTCIPARNPDAPVTIVADITGRTCALDVIVPDAQLPEVEVGDVLAFLDTGAYQDVGATNFNALPRPGTALVSGATAELIRRHETIDEVFARDLVPERLRGAANGDQGWRATGLDHFSITSGEPRPLALLLLRSARPRPARTRRGAWGEGVRDHRHRRCQRSLGRPRTAPRAGARADRVHRSPRPAQSARDQRSGRDPLLPPRGRYSRRPRASSRRRRERAQRAR